MILNDLDTLLARYDPTALETNSWSSPSPGVVNESLIKSVSTLNKGAEVTFPDGTFVRKTNGDADRFKVRLPGQRQRTITGVRPMVRLLEAHFKEG